MKIGDYKQMMAYLTRPEQPKEQVANLVDELTPGPLKDELKTTIHHKNLTKNIYNEKL
jgi:nitrous oxide reductase accessory protein NosL